MLASGRPVIAAAFPGTEIARVVQGCGLVVEPENADQFAAAMCQLADDAEERERLGAHARAYAEVALDQNRLLDQIEAALHQVVHGAASAAEQGRVKTTEQVGG
jgi:colanic acid biosynthesis glycosyl transferase WcaI